MADDNISLKIDLDAKEAKASAKKLRRDLAETFSNIDASKANSSLTKLELNLKSTATKSHELRREMIKFAHTEFATPEFEKVKKDISDTEARIRTLKEQLKKLDELGVKQSSQRYKGVQYDLDRAIAERNRLYSMRTGMAMRGEATQIGSELPKYAQMTAQLEKYNDQLRYGIQKLQEMAQKQGALKTDANIKDEGQEATKTAQSLGTLENQKKRTRKANSELGAESDNTKTKLLGESNASKTLSTSFNVLKRAVKGAWTAMKLIGKGAKNIINRLRGINKGTDDTKASMSNLAKFALKYFLGLRSIFILYKRIRQAGVEAYKGLASQFPELNAEVNELKNSFFQLKNSLATVAQPILSYLVPAIQTLMSWLVAAMNALANFFAIMTGAKYIYKATKLNKDWSESAKGAGKAAKEANEDIAEYDNLILIQQDKDSGGSGGAGAADDYAGAWEKVEAESDFAQKLKDAINEGNWEEVGNLFADKLNILTRKLDNWITGTLRPKGKKWAENIGRILNGLTEGWDAETFGKTIGDGLMALADIIATFWETYHFDKLGEKIGTAITSLFTAWEPETVARFLARKFNALAQFLAGVVAKTKFDLVGRKLGETFKELFTKQIKWRQLGKSVADLLRGVFTTIRTFIETSDLGNSIAYAINELLAGVNFTDFMTDLAKTANSLVSALGTAIRNTNWDEIGKGIAALITEINWTEVFKTVIITAEKLLGIAQEIIFAIADALYEVDWEEVGQAIADLLVSIDWGRFVTSLLKVALALIKGLGSALVQIASDPEALLSVAEGLLVIFGSKWLWGKITGIFKSGLTSALSGATSGLSIGGLGKLLGGAALGISTYDIVGRGAGSVAELIATAVGDDEMAKYYHEFSQAPIQYTVQAFSEAVEAAKEYSETTGRSTLGNAWHDMWSGISGDETTTEAAIRQSQEMVAKSAEMLERAKLGFSKENGGIGRAVTDLEWFAYKYGDTVKELSEASDELASNTESAFSGVGKAVNNLTKEMQTSVDEGRKSLGYWQTDSNHYAEIAKANAQTARDTVKQAEETANHYVEIAKQNSGYYDQIKQQAIESSNHYAEIAKANAKGVVDTAKQAQETSNHYVEIAKTNSGYYDKIQKDMEASSNHYVEIAKKNAQTVSADATEMVSNIEGSVATIPDSFDATFSSAHDKMVSSFDGTKAYFSEVAEEVKEPFGTMSEYFHDTFTDSWNSTVEVFSTNKPPFQAIQDSISGSFKNIINGMISGINSSFVGPFRALNNVIEKMRNIDVAGNKVFSVLPGITVPAIPKLAQGAVLPPNNPFIAMVGDQKSGTNVEAPLETIAEALRQVLSETRTTQNQTIVLQLNGRQIAQAVWDEENKRYKQTGARFSYT